MKKISKKLKYKLEYYLIIGFINILLLFPEKVRYSFAEKLGILGYHLIKKRRMIALANLKLAFPEKTDEERIKLAKENYKVLAKAYIASLWIMDYIFDETKVRVENYKCLDDAVAEGKGLVIASIHMGNLEASLKITEKYRLSDVVKAQRNPYIDEYITKNRSQLNFNMIKKSKGVSRELIKVLKNKEILALFSDHRDKGTTVNFFGRDTIAPTGAVHFALKFKTPLILGYSILNKDNTNTVKFTEKIKLIETGNLKEDVRVNTQLLINLIEKEIKKHPEQWMWFHDRWRLSKEFKK
jgi:KDO2-lipid IV(A) lauroyltransferase